MEENNERIDELLEQDMSYGEIADLLRIDLIKVIRYDNERKGIITRKIPFHNLDMIISSAGEKC